MSKIITSVAAMSLLEEGRIKLDDPVVKDLPALKGVKVFKGGTAAAPVVVPARAPITIKHLLTHTSGFIYGFGTGPLDKIYNSSDVFEATSLDEFVARAVKLPLAHEPGERFSYGINSDILGAVVEKVSGKTFEDFVDGRICRPLGMRDTGFDVPPEKMGRLAVAYEHPEACRQKEPTAANPVRVQPDASSSRNAKASSYPEKGRGMAAGGSGMFSTIGDYARLAQMLLNHGELDGVRILGTQDRGAHDRESSEPPAARDPRVQQLRRVRPRRRGPGRSPPRATSSGPSVSSDGAGRRPPPSTSTRKSSSSRWSLLSTGRSTSTTCSGTSTPSFIRRWSTRERGTVDCSRDRSGRDGLSKINWSPSWRGPASASTGLSIMFSPR